MKFSPCTASGMALPSERVGCVLWWSASVIKVDPAELRSAMSRHCPEHVGLVRKPQESAGAMRRAMRRRQGAAMGEGWRWEEVPVETGLLVALAQSERDAVALEYRASTRFTLALDEHGAVTRSRDPQGPEEVAALVSLMDRYELERGFLTQQDVRDLMVKVFLGASDGVRLKSGGAVYFLPVGKDEVIDRLAPAVALAGVTLMRFPVQSEDGFSVGQLNGAASSGLAEEAADLRKEAQEKLREVVEDGKRARYEALAGSLEKVTALRAKARLYKSLLSITTGEVDAALAETEAAVRETMKAIAARAA